MRVGIPRTLFYYAYFPLWYGFLRELGMEVIVSGETTRSILDAGVLDAVAEACIPIKVYHGHVAALREKVDLLFIPRIVNMTGAPFLVFCPKFLGLPDMVRFSRTDLPPILATRVDRRQGRKAFLASFHTMAAELGERGGKVRRAIRTGFYLQAQYERLLRAGVLPQQALTAVTRGWEEGHRWERASRLLPERGGTAGRLRLGVVGYPYIINDPYLSIGVLKRLQEMEVTPILPEMLPPRLLAQEEKRPGKMLFWTFSERVLRAGLHFLHNGEVDGLIHVTAFGCGPDSMVNKLLELEAKKCRTVPFLTLMVDEQTGEAGVVTRLEAFVDMVRRRKEGAVCVR